MNTASSLSRLKVLEHLREMCERGMDAEANASIQDSLAFSISKGAGTLVRDEIKLILYKEQLRVERLLNIFSVLDTELLKVVYERHLSTIAPVADSILPEAATGTPLQTFRALIGFYEEGKWVTLPGVPEINSGEDIIAFVRLFMAHFDTLKEAPNDVYTALFNLSVLTGEDFAELASASGAREELYSLLLKVDTASLKILDDRLGRDLFSTESNGVMTRGIALRIKRNQHLVEDFISYLNDRELTASEANWDIFEQHRVHPTAALTAGIL